MLTLFLNNDDIQKSLNYIPEDLKKIITPLIIEIRNQLESRFKMFIDIQEQLHKLCPNGTKSEDNGLVLSLIQQMNSLSQHTPDFIQSLKNLSKIHVDTICTYPGLFAAEGKSAYILRIERDLMQFNNQIVIAMNDMNHHANPTIYSSLDTLNMSLLIKNLENKIDLLTEKIASLNTLSDQTIKQPSGSSSLGTNSLFTKPN